MSTLFRRRVFCCQAFLVLVLASLFCMTSHAGGGPQPAQPQTKARNPKLREVVELPEDYYGREFTFTCRISTNGLWMMRAGDNFFLFLEDLEGSQLPSGGLSPDSTVNLIRFVLPKEEGRKLIDQLTATRKYEARVRFRIDREKDLFGQGWRYLGLISSVDLTQPAVPPPSGPGGK